jgi:hypothetical protein
MAEQQKSKQREREEENEGEYDKCPCVRLFFMRDNASMMKRKRRGGRTEKEAGRERRRKI